MKGTPWSRTRGQNSVHKELWEVVGSGKSMGSVLMEGQLQSLRGRMREMRRETEVPEERVPVVECLDGLARITSKELASTHSVKSGILQNACSTCPRTGADLGKSARMHVVRLMNNLVKGPKKNDDKSAVAMLKKNDWHENVR